MNDKEDNAQEKDKVPATGKYFTCLAKIYMSPPHGSETEKKRKASGQGEEAIAENKRAKEASKDEGERSAASANQNAGT